MVEVVTRHRGRRVRKDRVKDVVKLCSRSLLPAPYVISVAFLDDGEMAEINEEFKGRIGATDVLSFPLGTDDCDKKWYGEILISLDRAYRQASDKGVSIMDEVVRLLIHGIVHLSGRGHRDRKSFREMRKIELGLLLKCLSV